MLVLTRKNNESIIIGEDIVMTVIEVRATGCSLASTHRRRCRFTVVNFTKRLSVARL